MLDGSPHHARRSILDVHHKAGAQSEADPFEFVMSSQATDRMGDVIVAAGWRLANFKRNPIALYQHDHHQPIGTWKNVRVEGDRLVGKLELAAPGTSPQIDVIRALVEQRILRAVSVGFRGLEGEDILDAKGRWTGIRFTKSELLECSVVSVPAHPEALSIAKRFGLSAEERRALFAQPGDARRSSDPARAEHGASTITPARKGRAAMPRDNHTEDEDEGASISTRIRAKERALEKAQKALEDLNADVAEAGDMSAEQETQLDELTAQIGELSAGVARLKKLEQAVASHAAREKGSPSADRRPHSAPGVIVTPARGDSAPDKAKTLIEWIAANVVATEKGLRFEDVAERMFGRSSPVLGGVFTRANAEPPAMTSVPEWLGTFVGSEVVGFLQALAPDSLLPKLLARPSTASVSFRPGIGSVTIPVEGDETPPLAANTGVAGEFFGEGAPIRVGKGTIQEMTLAPKETGVIVPWTRKLEQYSAIDVVAFIERLVRRQTAMRLDAILLSNGAGSAITPPGLVDPAITGVTSTAFAPATAGAPTIAEIETAVGRLIDALGNTAIDPVLIMPGKMVERLGRVRTATGPKAFADELATGRFLMTSVLTHSTGPATEIYALDAARFVAAVGAPSFDISSEATLHMETATPLPLVAAGGTNPTVAAPQRSLFQTASRAVRMILDASWAVGGVGKAHRLTAVNL